MGVARPLPRKGFSLPSHHANAPYALLWQMAPAPRALFLVALCVLVPSSTVVASEREAGRRLLGCGAGCLTTTIDPAAFTVSCVVDYVFQGFYSAYDSAQQPMLAYGIASALNRVAPFNTTKFQHHLEHSPVIIRVGGSLLSRTSLVTAPIHQLQRRASRPGCALRIPAVF